MMSINAAEKDALLKIFPRGVIALDLEFTGLSALVDKIIEISALKITPDSDDLYSTKINPEIPIPKMATDICGITDQDVLDAPVIKDILKDLLHFIDDLPIIAHNAKFDLAFLVFSLHQEHYLYPKSKVYCSINFARKSIPEMPNYRLGTLIEKLELKDLTHHRSADDALACLKIFAQGLINLKPGDLEHPALRYAYLFSVCDYEKNKDFTMPKHLIPMLEVIKRGGNAEIKYSGGSKKNEFRPIKPVAFLPMPNGNILYAHCIESDLYKCYSLKKIREIKAI